MKQQEAINILSNTFSHEFNINNFIGFLKELLKDKINIQNRSLGVNKEYEDYIKNFKKIGEFKIGRHSIEAFAV